VAGSLGLDPYPARMAVLARRELDAGDAHGQERVLAQVAARAAEHLGVSAQTVAPSLVRWLDGRHAAETELPRPRALPELMGEVYGALLAGRGRRGSGSFYTPAELAGRLCAPSLAACATTTQPLSVCDPAVGGGAFLIAAARLQVERGIARDLASAVTASHGLDTDPLAVAVADTALRLLAAEDAAVAAPTIRLGDALARADALPAGGFDLVIGNPPFLGQLRSETARTAGLASELRRRFGLPALGYADTAHLFVLVALDAVRAGGQVALILPDSFLATRDGGPTRDAITKRSQIRWIWRASERLFDASVQVCAIGLERRAPPSAGYAIRRFAGPQVRESRPLDIEPRRSTGGASWSWMFAGIDGIPDTSPDGTGGTLARWCTATADFRDQFYGLVPYVIDDTDGSQPDEHFPRLVTVGLIDPARCLWGRRATRLAGRALERPRVDLRALEAAPAMARWAQARLVPKVLLATQTRVLEPVVDCAGAWLPSTPVISVQASGGASLWHIAAAIASPVATARALSEYGGAALSPGAIRLAARQVLELPAPAPGPAWDRSAAHLRAASAAVAEGTWRDALRDGAEASCEAHGIPETDARGLVEWWFARLPPWR